MKIAAVFLIVGIIVAFVLSAILELKNIEFDNFDDKNQKGGIKNGAK